MSCEVAKRVLEAVTKKTMEQVRKAGRPFRIPIWALACLR